MTSARDHATLASQLLDAAYDDEVDQEQREYTIELAAAHALTAIALTQTEGGK